MGALTAKEFEKYLEKLCKQRKEAVHVSGNQYWRWKKGKVQVSGDATAWKDAKKSEYPKEL